MRQLQPFHGGLDYLFLRLEPNLDQAADGIRATDFMVIGPSVDLGSQIGRQAHGAERFRLMKRPDGFWCMPANDDWLVHFTLLT